MSFDSGGSHQLFVADVGQNSWEEVNIVTAGGNYGWNVKEATHCFDAESPNQEPASCPDVVGPGHPRTGDPLIDPIIEYPQARLGGPGVAVVGGHVYRGSAPAPVPRPLRLRRLEPRLRPAGRLAVRGQAARARAVGDAASCASPPARPAG